MACGRQACRGRGLGGRPVGPPGVEWILKNSNTEVYYSPNYVYSNLKLHNPYCHIVDLMDLVDTSGASLGFQPNQGKNTQFKPVVKIVSYKRCRLFHPGTAKSFNVLDILTQMYSRLTKIIYFLFLMGNSILKCFVLLMLKSPLTSFLKHPVLILLRRPRIFK